jgi:hypothetical protein
MSEREKESERKWWGVLEDNTFYGLTDFFHLKVPVQCPLVLLLEGHLREGKALGNEEGKG